MIVSRVKRVTRQRPPSEVHASSMYVVVQLWLLVVIEQCSLMICPHLVPCPGRRERRSYLPWGMMVRHTQCNSHSFVACGAWLTSLLNIDVIVVMWLQIQCKTLTSLSLTQHLCKSLKRSAACCDDNIITRAEKSTVTWWWSKRSLAPLFLLFLLVLCHVAIFERLSGLEDLVSVTY